MSDFQDKQHSRILKLSLTILVVACFALWQQVGRVNEFVSFFKTSDVLSAIWIIVPILCLVLMVTAVIIVMTKSINEMHDIRKLAFIDELTELPNRRCFNGRLENELVFSIKSGQNLAVLYFDIDRFKVINDCYGRKAGDVVLIEFSKRLSKTIGESHFMARLSGDEFAAIVKNVHDEDDVLQQAERLLEEMKLPIEYEDKRLYAGASIGGVIISDATVDAMEALARADFALLDAKDAGRGRVSLFDPTMAKSIKDRNQLEADLREALDMNQLRLRYHPLISISSSSIVGVEALVRWAHPKRGIISPEDFIPIAEEIGVIDQLGEFVLRKACSDIHQRENIKLAVNISPKQFVQDGFVKMVENVLEETGFAANRLELEITEGILISDPDKTIKILTQLRELGVQIALDDFGTGFSSMSYLRQYPLDRIKIDKSFIAGMETEDEAFIFLSKIIELGGSLGMSVTVEGVETSQQLELLKKSKVNEIQGFYFSKPLTAGELQECDLVQKAEAALLGKEFPSNIEKKQASKRNNGNLRLVS